MTSRRAALARRDGGAGRLHQLGAHRPGSQTPRRRGRLRWSRMQSPPHGPAPLRSRCSHHVNRNAASFISARRCDGPSRHRLAASALAARGPSEGTVRGFQRRGRTGWSTFHVCPNHHHLWTSSSPAAASPAWRRCSRCAPWPATGSASTLVAPDAEFSYRPLAVAEPFSLGRAHRVPLSRFTEDDRCRARASTRRRRSTTPRPRDPVARAAGTRSFDALLVAPGGRAVAGRRGREHVVARRRSRALRRTAARHRGGLREAPGDRSTARRRLAAARL